MTSRYEQRGGFGMYSRFDWREATGRYRTHAASTAHLRVSDAERHEVADRLSRHFADGRLDQSEFDLRLGRATNAVTRGDLDGLFDDLPPLTEEVVPHRHRRRLIPLLVAIALVAFAIESVLSVARVPWILFVVIGLLLWVRFDRHDREHRHPSGVAR
jgi:Domain of unknown function (DUF1707)